MTTLTQLTERLEAANGADRELDFAIFRVLNPEFADETVWKPYASGLRHVCDGSDMRCLPPPEHTPPRYTASIDTTLILVGDNP